MLQPKKIMVKVKKKVPVERARAVSDSLKDAGEEKWYDSVKNPENAEYVDEVAFNLNKPAKKVTQKEFNKRYKP